MFENRLKVPKFFFCFRFCYVHTKNEVITIEINTLFAKSFILDRSIMATVKNCPENIKKREQSTPNPLCVSKCNTEICMKQSILLLLCDQRRWLRCGAKARSVRSLWKMRAKWARSVTQLTSNKLHLQQINVLISLCDLTLPVQNGWKTVSIFNFIISTRMA